MTRRRVIVIPALLATLAGSAGGSDFASPSYREPAPAVTRLLTANPPPAPLIHATSRRVALLHRQELVPLQWLARPYLGLAGFRFDPETRTSGRGDWVLRVEVATLSVDGAIIGPVQWTPPPRTRLEDVTFAPSGRHLAATLISTGPAQLMVFDIETGEQRTLPITINAAWGPPCAWVADDALLCRLVPDNLGPPPPLRPGPMVVEHFGAAQPARTYPDLLEDAEEDALFEHYFNVEMARVGLDGKVRRISGAHGLLADFQPSPDGKAAVITRIVPPYSRLLPASRFPRSIELWDLEKGALLGARSFTSKAPWRAAWKPGPVVAVGWIETDETSISRWMAAHPEETGPAQQIIAIERPLAGFGWTTAGTPYFRTLSDDGRRAQIFVVRNGQAHEIWNGETEDRYDNPGHALRVNGSSGPVLEAGGRVFLAGDGLGEGGPRPFLDTLDLASGTVERIFSSEPGVFEPVLALLATEPPWLLTSRETEAEPPTVGSVRISEGRVAERQAILPFDNPYPDLEDVERRVLSYRRKDGVELSATLYLPSGRRDSVPLPTLVWIYPREYSDVEFAEQVDIRAFRFPQIKGPHPLAAVLRGYAVVINPTMPIVGAGKSANDEYIPQLVASAEALVEYLVTTGISDPDRIAVGGRSYGAFSTANLLVHTQLFRSGIAMSGAYNRTLTPFGFQHEKRSFWKETDMYTRISPFFYADQLDEPLLLVHGGGDANPGTRPEQTRRFFQALVGNGGKTRFVELPYEDHVYTARESVLHAATETLEWLDRTIGPEAASTAKSLQ